MSRLSSLCLLLASTALVGCKGGAPEVDALDTGEGCEPTLELCNGEDDDCDGEIDESAADAGRWYLDEDADGWGAGEELAACEAPAGYVAVAGDCDDADPLRHPDADERCNGDDDDCDGDVDEDALDPTPWYLDADHDGWGTDADELAACEAPAGYVAVAGDCDDADPLRHPDADERCNGADDDCDGDVDEDPVDAELLYEDADGDGLGDPAVSETRCPTDGWVEDDQDAWPGCPGADDFAGGDGSLADPYQICEPDQLQRIEAHLSAHFLQTADLDLAGISLAPLGAEARIDLEGGGLSGTYDGGGYAISNFTYLGESDADDVPTGLFRQLEPGAVLADLTLIDAVVAGNNVVGTAVGVCRGDVSNLTLDGVDVTGRGSVGGAIGEAIEAELTELHAHNGTVYGTADGTRVGTVMDTAVAGLVAIAKGVHLTDSTVDLDVGRDPAGTQIFGWTSTAGAVGYFPYGAGVERCEAHGDVDGYYSAGGFIGYQSPTLITDCLATGDVTGVDSVGGFGGSTAGGAWVRVTATGDVVASGMQAGGLAGINWTTAIDGGVATGDVTAAERAGGLVGQSHVWSDPLITHCVTTGHVTATTQIAGGLVGFVEIWDGTAHRYHDNLAAAQSVTSPAQAGAFVGLFLAEGVELAGNYYLNNGAVPADPSATALTPAQAADPSSYSGWDFSADWKIATADALSPYPTALPVPAWRCDGVDVSCEP